MAFHHWNGKIELHDEIKFPYFIDVTIRVLPAVINDIAALNEAINSQEFNPFKDIKTFQPETDSISTKECLYNDISASC